MQNLLKVSLSFLFCILMHSAYAVGVKQVPVYDSPVATITVTKDAPRFVIMQPANPTTGYSWKTEYYDNKMLQLLVSNYQPPLNQLMGASGKMLWVFQARPEAFQKPMDSVIKLVYERQWDPNDHPVVVMFNVVSKP